MAINKNALIRYRTIDRCLQNSARKWTLSDLIDACSEALFDLEGRESYVSKRTIQLDISLMRGDKLGYHAPIEVYEKKYYRYADPDYSITDIPLNSDDMSVIAESVALLAQFKDFSLFKELNGIIQKLEDRIHLEEGQARAIIHVEQNDQLRGLNFLDQLYQAIRQEIVLEITYQSFNARQSSSFLFHGLILKEFNNRWFLVGKKDDQERVITLALDRILSLKLALAEEYRKTDFDADEYYKHTHGVTVLQGAQLNDIVLEVDAENAPYVITKPFHHSQELIEQREDGSAIIKLRVQQNLEFERLIFGFAESVKVLSPESLARRISYKLQKAAAQYQDAG